MNIQEYNIPKGAEFYQVTKSGIPCMFYRWNAVKCSDGSIAVALCFFSFTGLWCGSEAKGTDQLIPITDKPGYVVHYHRAVEGLQGFPENIEHVDSANELMSLMDRLKVDEKVNFAYYRADRSPLVVQFKGEAAFIDAR